MNNFLRQFYGAVIFFLQHGLKGSVIFLIYRYHYCKYRTMKYNKANNN